MVSYVRIIHIKLEEYPMLNYPNGKKTTTTKKGATTIYANRGLCFEDEINLSNDQYRLQNLAIIYKKPTPIKVVKMLNSKTNQHCITEAYFQAPSTTDYNGLYKGKYIDFETKETNNKTIFPLANIHLHQLEHMQQIVEHGGIGFLLVYFKMLNKIYLLDYQYVCQIHQEGKASIPFTCFLEKGHEVPQGYVVTIDYLKIVDLVYFTK